MAWLETLLLQQFLTFTLVLARVSGLILVAPIFAAEMMPARVRALLAVALALLATPPLLGQSPATPGDLATYLVWIAGELLVGLALGLGTLILFIGMQTAGQLISQLGGMSLADVFNPALDSDNPLVAQLFFYLTLALFLIIGGERLLLSALLDTFASIPPGEAGTGPSVVSALVTLVTQSFVTGIRAAAPTMAALLLATVVLGIVSRTLPQLNLLGVGFVLNSFLTLGALWLTVGGVAWVFEQQIEPAFELLQQAVVHPTSMPDLPGN